MNTYMKIQCRQMHVSLEIFRESLRLAALQDDQIIDAEEEEQLKQMNMAVDSFEAELKKLLDE